MKISVAICTRNRAASLDRTLASLSAARPPAHESWELLVVNNGSSDRTGQTIASWAGRLPLRRIDQETPGISAARNAAAAHARGDFVLWTDDDISVDRDWLAVYAQAFETHPDIGVFGGPIALAFDAPRPDWLDPALPWLRSAYAARDADDVPRRFGADDELPYGANFALRRAALRADPFDPRDGANPRHLLRRGEETRLLRRLLADGAQGLWLADAKVTHHIPASRMQIEYLWNYYRETGRDITLGKDPGSPLATAFSALQAAKRTAVGLGVRSFARLLRQPARAGRELRQAAFHWGALQAEFGRFGASVRTRKDT